MSNQVSEPKGFQVATANAALARLRNEHGARRFLIADEVGLGKTVVARTVISQMMVGRRSPLVVFYVASNLNIAHQNRAKLLEILPDGEDREEAEAVADRLSTAGNSKWRPTHERLHLYTLTPDTSVPSYRSRGGLGRLEERALVYRLLTGRLRSLDSGSFEKLCRGGVKNAERWASALRVHEGIKDVRDLQTAFLRALGEDESLELGEDMAAGILAAMQRVSPSKLMGKLRASLALAVVRSLQPDLIIFDEFQKFRDLLLDGSKKRTDPLVAALRGGEGRSGPALLLLSATPYRPYSSRAEDTDGSSHHQEFFELIRFLFGSDAATPVKIEAALREYGSEIQRRAGSVDRTRLAILRDEIERSLAPVLSRTERPESADAANGRAVTRPHSEICAEDLRVFKHWVARLQNGYKRARQRADLKTFAVPYWMSVPLPAQMLGRGYVAWKHADLKGRRKQEPALRASQRD